MLNKLNNISRRQWNLFGFLLCTTFILYALYTQHYGGLDPCNLCIFQRVAFIALALVFLIAFIHNPQEKGRFLYVIDVLIAGGIGAAIAARHVWIQHNPPEGLVSCGGDLGYLMDTYEFNKVFAIVLEGSGDCGTIDWQFLGFSMPEWTLFWFVVITVAGVWVNWKK